MKKTRVSVDYFDVFRENVKSYRRHVFIAATFICLVILFTSMSTAGIGSPIGSSIFIIPPKPNDNHSVTVVRTNKSSDHHLEHRHIVFIKVHKAGSSTISNILFRFGISRNLTFALPKKGVIINLYQNQPLRVKFPIKGNNQPFDILCNHAVYNESKMAAIMAPDVKYITIVREPTSLLQSSLYYFFPKIVKGKNKLHKYLQHPSLVRNRRLLNNSMSYELGLPPEHFYNRTMIDRFLDKIDQDFSVIMITERMAESTLLLKRVMHWTLRDVIYISRNVNNVKPKLEITYEDSKSLKSMLIADNFLYEFSLKRLESQLVKQADFHDELRVFNSILNQVNNFCTSETSKDQLHISDSLWNQAFILHRKDCEILQFNGFQILNYARHHQSGNLFWD